MQPPLKQLKQIVSVPIVIQAVVRWIELLPGHWERFLDQSQPNEVDEWPHCRGRV